MQAPTSKRFRLMQKFYRSFKISSYWHAKTPGSAFGLANSRGKAVGFLPRSGLELARSICPDLRAVRCPLPGGDRTVQLMRKKKSLLSETALDFWDFALDYFNLPPDGED